MDTDFGQNYRMNKYEGPRIQSADSGSCFLAFLIKNLVLVWFVYFVVPSRKPAILVHSVILSKIRFLIREN
jgi:hypothetical protein